MGALIFQSVQWGQKQAAWDTGAYGKAVDGTSREQGLRGRCLFWGHESVDTKMLNSLTVAFKRRKPESERLNACNRAKVRLHEKRHVCGKVSPSATNNSSASGQTFDFYGAPA